MPDETTPADETPGPAEPPRPAQELPAELAPASSISPGETVYVASAVRRTTHEGDTVTLEFDDGRTLAYPADASVPVARQAPAPRARARRRSAKKAAPKKAR